MRERGKGRGKDDRSRGEAGLLYLSWRAITAVDSLPMRGDTRPDIPLLGLESFDSKVARVCHQEASHLPLSYAQQELKFNRRYGVCD